MRSRGLLSALCLVVLAGSVALAREELQREAVTATTAEERMMALTNEELLRPTKLAVQRVKSELEELRKDVSEMLKRGPPASNFAHQMLLHSSVNGVNQQIANLRKQIAALSVVSDDGTDQMLKTYQFQLQQMKQQIADQKKKRDAVEKRTKSVAERDKKERAKERAEEKRDRQEDKAKARQSRDSMMALLLKHRAAVGAGSGSAQDNSKQERDDKAKLQESTSKREAKRQEERSRKRKRRARENRRKDARKKELDSKYQQQVQQLLVQAQQQRAQEDKEKYERREQEDRQKSEQRKKEQDREEKEKQDAQLQRTKQQRDAADDEQQRRVKRQSVRDEAAASMKTLTQDIEKAIREAKDAAVASAQKAADAMRQAADAAHAAKDAAEKSDAQLAMQREAIQRSLEDATRQTQQMIDNHNSILNRRDAEDIRRQASDKAGERQQKATAENGRKTERLNKKQERQKRREDRQKRRAQARQARRQRREERKGKHIAERRQKRERRRERKDKTKAARRQRKLERRQRHMESASKRQARNQANKLKRVQTEHTRKERRSKKSERYAKGRAAREKKREWARRRAERNEQDAKHDQERKNKHAFFAQKAEQARAEYRNHAAKVRQEALEGQVKTREKGHKAIMNSLKESRQKAKDRRESGSKAAKAQRQMEERDRKQQHKEQEAETKRIHRALRKEKRKRAERSRKRRLRDRRRAMKQRRREMKQKKRAERGRKKVVREAEKKRRETVNKQRRQRNEQLRKHAALQRKIEAQRRRQERRRKDRLRRRQERTAKTHEQLAEQRTKTAANQAQIRQQQQREHDTKAEALQAAMRQAQTAEQQARERADKKQAQESDEKRHDEQREKRQAREQATKNAQQARREARKKDLAKKKESRRKRTRAERRRRRESKEKRRRERRERRHKKEKARKTWKESMQKRREALEAEQKKNAKDLAEKQEEFLRESGNKREAREAAGKARRRKHQLEVAAKDHDRRVRRAERREKVAQKRRQQRERWRKWTEKKSKTRREQARKDRIKKEQSKKERSKKWYYQKRNFERRRKANEKKSKEHKHKNDVKARQQWLIRHRIRKERRAKHEDEKRSKFVKQEELRQKSESRHKALATERHNKTAAARRKALERRRKEHSKKAKIQKWRAERRQKEWKRREVRSKESRRKDATRRREKNAKEDAKRRAREAAFKRRLKNLNQHRERSRKAHYAKLQELWKRRASASKEEQAKIAKQIAEEEAAERAREAAHQAAVGRHHHERFVKADKEKKAHEHMVERHKKWEEKRAKYLQEQGAKRKVRHEKHQKAETERNGKFAAVSAKNQQDLAKQAQEFHSKDHEKQQKELTKLAGEHKQWLQRRKQKKEASAKRRAARRKARQAKVAEHKVKKAQRRQRRKERAVKSEKERKARDEKYSKSSVEGRAKFDEERKQEQEKAKKRMVVRKERAAKWRVKKEKRTKLCKSFARELAKQIPRSKRRVTLRSAFSRCVYSNCGFGCMRHTLLHGRASTAYRFLPESGISSRTLAIKRGTVPQCTKICLSHRRCRGFTRPSRARDWHVAVCKFKSSARTHDSRHVNSFIITGEALARRRLAPPARLRRSRDVVGYTLAHIKGTGYRCVKACRAHHSCVAFTRPKGLRFHQHGSCWLKSRRGPATPSRSRHLFLVKRGGWTFAQREFAWGRPISLFGGWTRAGGIFNRPSFTVSRGVCFLSGFAKGTTGLVGTLPRACRPRAGRLVFSAMRGNAQTRIDILPNGRLYSKLGAGKSWLSLDGIAFHVADLGQRKLSLVNGWTNYGAGYRAAQLNRLDGLCVLSGLVKQGNWTHLAQVAKSCFPRDGRLVFATNNHQGSTRLDLTHSGKVVYAGGSHTNPWASFDGLVWSPFGGKQLKLRSGWKNIGNGYRTARVSRVGHVCIVSGVVGTGNSASFSRALTRLPASCRPGRRMVFVSNANGATARVDVTPAGFIRYVSGRGQNQWISLANIRFVPDYKKQALRYYERKRRAAAARRARLAKKLHWTSGMSAAYFRAKRLAYGHRLPLVAQWQAFSSRFLRPSFRLYRGVCSLSGLAKGASGKIARLPRFCRPAGSLVFTVLKGGKPARVDVKHDGAVVLLAGDAQNSWLSLDGITFAVGKRSLQAVTLDDAWKNFGFGYRNVQANKIGGLCLLSGLAKGNSWANFAKVSSACRPDSRVVFSVSNHGSVTHTEVDEKGLVVYGGGAKDHKWTSFDGIVYTPKQGKAIKLASDWKSANGTQRPATWKRVGRACVLSGVVSSSSWKKVIGRLPVFCRPIRPLVFSANADSTSVRVDVHPSGAIVYVSGRPLPDTSSHDCTSSADCCDGASCSVPRGGSGRKCVLPNDILCPACPDGQVYKNGQCAAKTADSDPCKPNPCPSGQPVCTPSKKVCIRAPCEQYTCSAASAPHEWLSLSNIHFFADIRKSTLRLWYRRHAARLSRRRARFNPRLYAKQRALSLGRPIGLASKWQDASSHFSRAAYRVHNGICVLSGVIKGKGRYVGQLPAACRPSGGRIIASVFSWPRGSARFDVAKDGKMFWRNGRKNRAGLISLDGVHFAVGNRGRLPIKLASGWTHFGKSFRHAQLNYINGVCALSGVIKSGTHTTFTSVPRECKPADGRLVLTSPSSKGVTRVDVNANGAVIYSGGAKGSWVGLDGLSWTRKGGMPLKMFAGWRHFGKGYRAVKVRRVGRLCVLSGLATSPKWKAYITKLPAWCRPARRSVFTANTHASVARVDILRSGAVAVVSGNGRGWLSLSSIKFIAHPVPSPAMIAAHEKKVAAIRAAKAKKERARKDFERRWGTGGSSKEASVAGPSASARSSPIDVAHVAFMRRWQEKRAKLASGWREHHHKFITHMRLRALREKRAKQLARERHAKVIRERKVKWHKWERKVKANHTAAWRRHWWKRERHYKKSKHMRNKYWRWERKFKYHHRRMVAHHIKLMEAFNARKARWWKREAAAKKKHSESWRKRWWRRFRAWKEAHKRRVEVYVKHAKVVKQRQWLRIVAWHRARAKLAKELRVWKEKDWKAKHGQLTAAALAKFKKDHAEWLAKLKAKVAALKEKRKAQIRHARKAKRDKQIRNRRHVDNTLSARPPKVAPAARTTSTTSTSTAAPSTSKRNVMPAATVTAAQRQGATAAQKAIRKKHIARRRGVAARFASARKQSIGLPIKLSSGWTPFGVGTGFAGPRWRLSQGMCFLSGEAKGTASSGLIATLPRACRPRNGRLVFGVMKGGASARVDVLADGRVLLVTGGGKGKWVSFDGIAFVAHSRRTLNFPLVSGWTNYGSPYRAVQSNKVRGICSLSGLAKKGEWKKFGRVEERCWPFDGSLSFAVNNHKGVSRLDVAKRGAVVFAGGDKQHSWTSFDGMLWVPGSEGTPLRIGSLWKAAAGEERAPKVSRTGHVCVLSGAAEPRPGQPGDDALIGTLPRSCRPYRRMIFPGFGDNGAVRVDVLPSGQVRLVSKSGLPSRVSLNNIHFVAHPSFSSRRA